MFLKKQAGAGGFEPPIYSLGGCRLIRTRPRALFRLSRITNTYINLSGLARSFFPNWDISLRSNILQRCEISSLSEISSKWLLLPLANEHCAQNNHEEAQEEPAQDPFRHGQVPVNAYWIGIDWRLRGGEHGNAEIEGIGERYALAGL